MHSFYVLLPPNVFLCLLQLQSTTLKIMNSLYKISTYCSSLKYYLLYWPTARLNWNPIVGNGYYEVSIILTCWYAVKPSVIHLHKWIILAFLDKSLSSPHHQHLLTPKLWTAVNGHPAPYYTNSVRQVEPRANQLIQRDTHPNHSHQGHLGYDNQTWIQKAFFYCFECLSLSDACVRWTGFALLGLFIGFIGTS